MALTPLDLATDVIGKAAIYLAVMLSTIIVHITRALIIVIGHLAHRNRHHCTVSPVSRDLVVAGLFRGIWQTKVVDKDIDDAFWEFSINGEVGGRHAYD